MKRFIIAIVALGAPLAFAQVPYQAPQAQPQVEAPKAGATKAEASGAAGAKPSVEVPKHKCEDPGPYPGRVGMQTEDRRNRFNRAYESYRNCMVAFIEERRAVAEANTNAFNATVKEYNTLNARIKQEAEAAQN